jgi:hypothetical protein
MGWRATTGWILIVIGFIFLLQWLNMFFSGNPMLLGLKLLKGVSDSLEPIILALAFMAAGWMIKRE